MSEENVELVREGWDAFLSQDVERAMALAHPDVVGRRNPPLPDPKTYHGWAGVIEMYVDWIGGFDEFEMETGEYIDAGDRVIVEVIQRARGHASGAPVEGRFWFASTIAEGKMTRLDVFNSKQQALETADGEE